MRAPSSSSLVGVSRVRLFARDSATARFNLVRRTRVGRPFAHSIALACSFSPASAARATRPCRLGPARRPKRRVASEAAPPRQRPPPAQPRAQAERSAHAKAEAETETETEIETELAYQNASVARAETLVCARAALAPVAFLRAVGSSHSEWHSAQRWRATRGRGRPARGKGGGGGEGAREEREGRGRRARWETRRRSARPRNRASARPGGSAARRRGRHAGGGDCGGARVLWLPPRTRFFLVWVGVGGGGSGGGAEGGGDKGPTAACTGWVDRHDDRDAGPLQQLGPSSPAPPCGVCARSVRATRCGRDGGRRR